MHHTVLASMCIISNPLEIINDHPACALYNLFQTTYQTATTWTEWWVCFVCIPSLSTSSIISDLYTARLYLHQWRCPCMSIDHSVSCHVVELTWLYQQWCSIPYIYFSILGSFYHKLYVLTTLLKFLSIILLITFDQCTMFLGMWSPRYL